MRKFCGYGDQQAVAALDGTTTKEAPATVAMQEAVAVGAATAEVGIRDYVAIVESLATSLETADRRRPDAIIAADEVIWRMCAEQRSRGCHQWLSGSKIPAENVVAGTSMWVDKAEMDKGRCSDSKRPTTRVCLKDLHWEQTSCQPGYSG